MLSLVQLSFQLTFNSLIWLANGVLLYVLFVADDTRFPLVTLT